MMWVIITSYVVMRCLSQKLEWIEAHLKHVVNVRHRKLLTKLRIGVLSLRVESGRYEFWGSGVEKKKGLPIEFRLCQCCDLRKVEDEMHFMLECPLYKTERQKLQQSCRLKMREGTFVDFKLQQAWTGADTIDVIVSLIDEMHLSSDMSCNSKICV